MTQVSSLYLHVPFCMHLCNYCDFYKRKLVPGEEQFEDFHQFLLASHQRHEELLNSHGISWGSLETVYLGGGTPSLWGSIGAEFFSRHFLKKGLPSNAEFTMEIDPGTWTNELIESWQKIGLNRISIGTQSLNPTFLKIMDRVHSVEESLHFLSFLHRNNWNYSLDFILGIPYSQEKKRNIKEEIDRLLAYSPKHISLYILNARSKYPHVQAIPDDEYIREEYLFVSDYLKSQGFHHYEVSNFALPGFEAVHNQKYWRGESVMALGPTGTGYFALAEDKAIRYKWKVTRPEVEIEELTLKELSLERTYLKLRTSDGWEAPAKLRCLMQSWKQQGHAIEEGKLIKLTAVGYLMLDSLMDDLFRSGL